METKIFDISNPDIYDEALNEAAQAVGRGGIVVFPTETVYGLGADARNTEAVNRIFVAKGRPNDNPLIVHLADRGDIFLVGRDISEAAKKAFEAFTPGPISIIVKKNDSVSDAVTAGLDTVAVRIPALKAARDFIEKCGCPIAAPSANISGKPSPTAPQHVIHDMCGKADVILTYGECEVGVESTVTEISDSDEARIYRPGKITAEDIERVTGLKTVKYYKTKSSETPKSPGMKYRHYKPSGHVTTLVGERGKITDYINAHIDKTKKTACIVFDDYRGKLDCPEIFYLGAENDNDSAARLIFSHLRSCDSEGIEEIFVTATDNRGIGEAFMNRITRASDELINL